MNKRVFVAGHQGMVGAAITGQLAGESDIEIVTRARSELDLTQQRAVADFFSSQKIDEVYLCAAKVGGIHANNTYPADFIYENLMIEANVIHQASNAGVEKLMLLGSSCIYPKMASQPMAEEALLTGPLEATNEPYAVAKIAGIKLCESYNRQYGTDYRSVMPTNLFGPGDNFHPDNSHVIPALIRRFHEASQSGLDRVTVWGTGKAKREFLHVDDMARATVYVMNLQRADYAAVTRPMQGQINVGSGDEYSIAELAAAVAELTGFPGEIEFDSSKPDGAPRKLLDTSKLRTLGWTPEYDLRSGLENTYAWYLANSQRLRD